MAGSAALFEREVAYRPQVDGYDHSTGDATALANQQVINGLEEAYSCNYPEEHGHSMAAHRRYGIRRQIGRLAIEDPAKSMEAELAAREMAFTDYSTGVTEMLKTDAEFRDSLDVETTSSHDVIGNRILAKDGSFMDVIVETGVESAISAARKNPELKPQIERCSYDVEIVQRAQELEPGMTLWGVSMEPKKELRDYKETYKGLGYREGLIYLQAYTRVNENMLIAQTFSVDKSNETTWRKVLKDYGMKVPEGISNNAWLHYAAEQPATAEEAKALISTIRDDYYDRQERTRERYSITGYVTSNIKIVEQFFDAYYPALADAAYSKSNNPTLRKLADTMLAADIAKLKPEIKAQLREISKSKQFSAEDGRVLDSIIRYAVVEQLRKGLTGFVESDGKITQAAASDNISSQQDIDGLMASNVKTGVEAGRSYGGCPGNIELSAAANDGPLSNKSVLSQQEAFGGLSCPEVTDGQMTTCPGCKKRVRAIVPDRETIYCSNEKCDLAAPELKNKQHVELKVTKKQLTKAA